MSLTKGTLYGIYEISILVYGDDVIIFAWFSEFSRVQRGRKSGCGTSPCHVAESMPDILMCYKVGYDLHYWESDNTAEVDFLIQKDSHVIPVECKAGNHMKK